MASTTVVDIAGGNEDERVATAQALMERLRTDGDTKEVRSGFAETDERKLFDFFAHIERVFFLPLRSTIRRWPTG